MFSALFQNHITMSSRESILPNTQWTYEELLATTGVVWMGPPAREATVSLEKTVVAPVEVSLDAVASVISELDRMFHLKEEKSTEHILKVDFTVKKNLKQTIKFKLYEQISFNNLKYYYSTFLGNYEVIDFLYFSS